MSIFGNIIKGIGGAIKKPGLGLAGAAGLTPLGWGVGLGLTGIGMGMKALRNKGSGARGYENLYGDYYRPFDSTKAGMQIQGELDSFDVDTERGLGDFQRVTTAGAPTIGDFIGASYAQGGRGLRARQLSQQHTRSAMAAAAGGYNDFRRQRDGYKGNLLNMMMSGQARQQSLAHMQSSAALPYQQQARQGTGILGTIGGSLLAHGFGSAMEPKNKWTGSGVGTAGGSIYGPGGGGPMSSFVAGPTGTGFKDYQFGQSVGLL